MWYLDLLIKTRIAPTSSGPPVELFTYMIPDYIISNQEATKKVTLLLMWEKLKLCLVLHN